MELNTDALTFKFAAIVAIDANSAKISGNMNNILHRIDMNCDLWNSKGEFEKGKLIHFTYDFRNDICCWFHDDDLILYYSDGFDIDDMNKIKKSITQKLSIEFARLNREFLSAKFQD